MGFRDKYALRRIPLVLDDGNAYASGDALDEVKTIPYLSLDDKGGTVLHSITIIDKEGFAPNLNIIFFNGDPLDSAIAANSPLETHVNDFGKIIGVFAIPNGNYVDIGTNKKAVTFTDLNLVLQAANFTKDIYFALVTEDAVTYANDDSLEVVFGIAQQ